MLIKTSYLTISLVFTLACGILAIPSQKQEQEARIEPITTSLLVSALTPAITNLLQGVFGSLFTPNDYQDTTIYGRSMRIKMCGDTCVQLTDRASGITVVGTGNSAHEAIGDATQKMFHELLDKNLLSLFDLCHLNIKFPHPDQQNCPGVQINPCDLLELHTTTKPMCTNKFGDSYCQRNSAKCTDHYYQTFMFDNCYKECTNGCQINPGPVNPCAVGRLY